MAAEMESILRKLKLDYLIKRFNIEKITPDLVGKLSLNEFKELGVQNRNDIMVVRMECSKYGSNKPPRSRSTRNECGAPMFQIPRSVLGCYLEQNLKNRRNLKNSFSFRKHNISSNVTVPP